MQRNQWYVRPTWAEGGLLFCNVSNSLCYAGNYLLCSGVQQVRQAGKVSAWKHQTSLQCQLWELFLGSTHTRHKNGAHLEEEARLSATASSRHLRENLFAFHQVEYGSIFYYVISVGSNTLIFLGSEVLAINCNVGGSALCAIRQGTIWFSIEPNAEYHVHAWQYICGMLAHDVEFYSYFKQFFKCMFFPTLSSSWD